MFKVNSKVVNFFSDYFEIIEDKNNINFNELIRLLGYLEDDSFRELIFRGKLEAENLANTKIKELTQFHTNCIFLYTLIISPNDWDEKFATLLTKLVDSFIV